MLLNYMCHKTELAPLKQRNMGLREGVGRSHEIVHGHHPANLFAKQMDP